MTATRPDGTIIRSLLNLLHRQRRHNRCCWRGRRAREADCYFLRDAALVQALVRPLSVAYLDRLGLGGGQSARNNEEASTSHMPVRRFDMRFNGLRRFSILTSFSSAALIFGIQTSLAQVIAPPRPATYNAEIRYQIAGTRRLRLEQFFAMTKFLEAHGLKEAPGTEELAEDPTITRLQG